jgi:hypothetical protein
MAVESLNAQNRQSKQQAEPGGAHTDPVADPLGHVLPVPAPESRLTLAMREELRKEDDHEGRDRSRVEISRRHLR